jgi:hypothetical protein
VGQRKHQAEEKRKHCTAARVGVGLEQNCAQAKTRETAVLFRAEDIA